MFGPKGTLPMKTPSFVRAGWFYLPRSVGAGVLCLLAVAFCATVFIAVDRHSHSASDTLYGIYPYFVSTFLLLDWVARRWGESEGDMTCAPSADQAPHPR